MKFSIQTSDLAQALSVVTRAISPKAVQPILEGVLIEASNGTVLLTASNGSMSIRKSVTAITDEEGNAVLNGKLLNDLARRLPGSETTFETKVNQVRIRSGSSRTNLAMYEANSYPPVEEVKQEHVFHVSCEQLRTMIEKVSFCVCADETRQILTGISMNLTGGSVEAVALDGFRMALTSTNANNLDEWSIVVPGAAAKEIARILPQDDNVCRMYIGSSKLSVTFTDTVLTTVLLSGAYPDYHRITPTSFATDVLVNRSTILSAIDRASLTARAAHDNLIRLHIADNQIKLTARNETADIEETFDCAVTGPDLTLAFNASYMTDALRSISSDSVTLRMNTPLTPCIIKPEDENSGNTVMYMVLPVRTLS